MGCASAISLGIAMLACTACVIGAAAVAPTAATVVVIGSGAAGLAAARMLHDANVSVIVLEAQSRAGGRMHTVTSKSGLPIDLGASWIHGVGNVKYGFNPIYQLAQKANLSSFPSRDKTLLLSADGIPVSDATDAKYGSLYSAFANAVQAYQTAVDSGQKADVPLQTIVNTFIKGRKLLPADAAGLLQQINTRIEQEYAADIVDLSTYSLDGDSAYPGEDRLLAAGYIGIVNLLSAGLDIRYNWPVSLIDYNNAKVAVSTTGGVTYTADYVIVTVPLGYLQAHHTTLFSPPLPGAKVHAINTLGMGLLDKVVMLFDTPVGSDGYDWVDRIPSAAENRTAFVEFAPLHFRTGRPILMAFNMGRWGRSLEQLNDTAILSAALGVVRRLYPNAKVPAPKEFWITRWAQDPWTLGSYSYAGVGTVNPTTYNALAAPVDGCVFFAGEATSDQYFATVHGAYLTGQREAQRVLNDL